MVESKEITAIKNLLSMAEDEIEAINMYISAKKHVVDTQPYKTIDELVKGLQRKDPGHDLVKADLLELMSICVLARKDLAKNSGGKMAPVDQELSDSIGEFSDNIKKVLAGSANTWLPRTLVDAYKPRPPIEYAMGTMFEIPSLNIIYAPPSSHKSNIAIDMAIHIVTGEPWLPPAAPSFNGKPIQQDVEAFEIERQRSVAWIDQDNGERRTDDRFAMFGRGINAPPSAPIFYVSMPSPPLQADSVEAMRQLRKTVAECKAEVLFVDNLGTILGEADENTMDMVLVMTTLRRLAEDLKIAVILIHHERKTQGVNEREGYRLRGHSSIEAAVDNAFRISRDPENPENVTIYNTKSRGEHVQPIGAQFWFEKDNTGTTVKAGFFGMAVGSDLTYASQCAVVYDIIEKYGESNQKTIIGLAQGNVKNGKRSVGRHAIEALLERMVNENKLEKVPGEKRNEILYRRA